MNDTDPALDSCGCCAAPAEPTPVPLHNAPGLPALAWRAGTHGRFLAAQKLRLAAHPALRALSTREPSDPAIALLDAWSCVLDVLTFHQERFAQENYLRTATERRSLLELARAIGYELRPGVAASTALAFTMESVPGSPASARLDAGVKVQSVPGQNEKPQIFETVETIEARPVWNALRPRLTEPSIPLYRKQVYIYLDGTATGLQPGDALLFIGDERKNNPGSERWDFRRVASLELFPLPPLAGPSAGYTRVRLDRPLGSFTPPMFPSVSGTEVYALRQRAGVFGGTAVDWKALPDLTKKAYLGLADNATLTAEQKKEWPAFTVFRRGPAAPQKDGVTDPAGDGGPYLLDLDQSYPKIVAAGGWIVLSTPDYQEVYRIDSAVEYARAEFGLSAKVTRITLGAGENHDKFDPALREVVVYAQSERLAFAQRPIDDPVEGGELVLATAVADLAPGRLLALTGTDAATGLAAAEIVEIQAVSLTVENLTALTLSAHLARAYIRDTVFLNANVARATHGETKRDELLGSGDGARPFQSFVLKQKPLTHVSSPLAPGGATPAIEIRVSGVRWREVPSFYGVGASERVYTLRRADDGTTTVRFGDGRTGARLPTGVNNVVATYRAGLGFEGQVAAGSLSTLLSRPLGAKAVVNPLAAAGAADPEKLADARDNAPLTVLTLDRVVSLRDHEDYARAFAGIGKARADALWDGERQLVHLTVAAADGGPVDPASATFKDLRASLDAARHASRPLFLSPHTQLRFGLSARVATDPDLVRDQVLAELRAALAAAFSFPARAFGQGVAASQLLAAMQAVPGVVAVDLDSLGLVSDAGVYSPQDALTAPKLPARVAYRDVGNVLHGAELLLLDPDSVALSDLPA